MMRWINNTNCLLRQPQFWLSTAADSADAVSGHSTFVRLESDCSLAARGQRGAPYAVLR